MSYSQSNILKDVQEMVNFVDVSKLFIFIFYLITTHSGFTVYNSLPHNLAKSLFLDSTL